MKENFEINIAHFYPELLNIYGDYGNIRTLEKRLEWRNIKVTIDKISQNENINFEKYDIIFIGGGQDKQQKVVSELLQKHASSLKKLAENDVVMLAICGGFQLFGNYYETSNGEILKGIGIFDAYTVAGKERSIGNVTIETDFLSPNTIVGFENHLGQTYLNKGVLPLGKVIKGNGNNKKDNYEGARYRNVFGTYLHGPLLPKNNVFADYLLQTAIRRKLNDANYCLAPLDNTFEEFAHLEAISK